MKLSSIGLAIALFTSISNSTFPIALAQSTQSPQMQMNPSTIRSASDAAAPQATGGLYVQSDTEQRVFPLIHTDVTATVSGNLSRVEVTQTFENPFEESLEAVYVFPLPDEAAVDAMEIKLGDRTIRGDIKRREEARQIYEQAIQEGRTAGLLEQERANIFTQSVANIRPGEQVEVTIRYTESLRFEDTAYEFVFPMVVGPRYIPGVPTNPRGDTDQVSDASRITPPVLHPDERSGHDISVMVNIEAGIPIREVRSPSHEIQTQHNGDRIQVQLADQDTIPNKDLILRYQISDENTQATVLTQADDRGGHFAAYLVPAIDYPTDEIVPKDVVFLMDTSGSQQGEPLAKSQELMRRMINGLNPDDTFTIIDFANTAARLSSAPLPNTPQNRQRAIAYVNRLTANGGTELLNGMQSVLDFPAAEAGRLRSIVLLTDGYIGNEASVIAEVQQRLNEGNRLYGFGVGSSVNRFLLNRLAEVGRGTVQVVRHDEPTEEAIEQFFQHINNPVLTNIQVEWNGQGDAPDMYPLAAPDLFANQPLVLFGRKADRLSGTLTITGTAAGGQPYAETLNINFDDTQPNEAIAQLWGRAKIKDLMNQMYGGETVSGVEAVTQTALEYRLLSQYTSFVAMSEEVRVDPDGTRRTVQVPVELPEGVSYEGIFGAPEAASQMGTPPAGFATLQRRSRGAMPSAGVAPSLDTALENRPIRPAQPPIRRVSVIDVEGLDESAIARLEPYLQRIQPPTDVSGEVVWELRLWNGRIERILLDDRASTLHDQTTLNAMRRSLQMWQPPDGVTGTVRIRLSVSP
ncbi:MAG: VIT domain-containing protein [Elainellaceae cyanobacterium]